MYRNWIGVPKSLNSAKAVRLSLLSVGESGWLAGALVVAASLKALLLTSSALPFNADEAVVALMARHILQGARPVFFYGQAYMGSLDAYLVAVGFAIFGQEVWVLRFVQALLYLGTLATTVELGKIVLGSIRAGVLAAWLLAIPTINVTLYTTVTLGGYGEMLLLGNLILLAALRIATILSSSRPPAQWRWLAFGFLCGLGLWAFGMTLVYSLPAVVFVIYKVWKAGSVSDPTRLRMPAALRARPDTRDRAVQWLVWAGWVAIGALVGASPWLGYALTNGPRSLVSELAGSAIVGVDGSPYPVQVVRHAFNLVVFGLPAALGLRAPWEVRWLALPLAPFALAFWLGVTVFSIRQLLRRERPTRARFGYPPDREGNIQHSAHANLYQTLLCRVDKPGDSNRSAPLWLLAGVAITVFTGFVLTPFGVDPSGRYFLPLAVVLTLFGAAVVLHAYHAWGRRAYALVGLILLFNAWGTLECILRTPPGLTTQFDAGTRIDHRFDPALVQFLLDSGEYRGYSTYWVAYPLAFASQEALIFVPKLPYHQDFRYTTRDNRYEPYERQVSEAKRAAYITANHPALDEQMRDSFAALRVNWMEKQIGDYHLFYSISRHVRPDELDLAPAPQNASMFPPNRFVR